MTRGEFTEERAADPLDDVGEAAPDDRAPLREQTPAPPARVSPVVVPRWIQLVLLPLAILAGYGLLRAAGPIALLFIVAGLVALLLNPFVVLLRRAGFPRGLAVLTVLLTLVLCVGGAGVLLANPVADQVSALQRNVPEIVDNANAELADLQDWLDRNGIGIQVKEQGEPALQTLGKEITKGSGDIVAFTREALTVVVEASIALILIAVLSVYMLLYGERIGQVVRSIVPKGDGSPEDDFPTRIQKAVLGYVRGQLLFSTIMGASAGVMLYVLGSVGIFEDGKTYALFFGVFYGVAELIPYVGPAIGGAPAGIICLLGPDPLDAVWLAIGFIALQQIEGHIVAPQVFGHSLRINPLLVILALLMGGQLYGFVGAFIALPLAAILRETAVYLRRHLVLEPWAVMAPAGAPLIGAGLQIGEHPGAGPPGGSGVPGGEHPGAGPPGGSGVQAGEQDAGSLGGARRPTSSAEASEAVSAPGAPAADPGGGGSAVAPPHVESGRAPVAELGRRASGVEPAQSEPEVGAEEDASGAESAVSAPGLSGAARGAKVAESESEDDRRTETLADGPAAEESTAETQCPECGVSRETEGTVCEACGTELGASDESAAAGPTAPR